jgi:hypothetical protein
MTKREGREEGEYKEMPFAFAGQEKTNVKPIKGR